MKVSTCRNCGVRIETVTDTDDRWLHKPEDDDHRYYAECLNPPYAQPVDDESTEYPYGQDGVWIVYEAQQNLFGGNLGFIPLYIHKDELMARRYQEALGFLTHVKFWIFGEEFGTR